MSLVVLNSKGSQAEDFSNYLSENIVFPKNAEICLVSTHINRKFLVPKEVEIVSGGNTLTLQYGKGQYGSRDTTGYTPHAPSQYNFHEPNQIFPLKYKGTANISAGINNFMNNKDNTLISTLVGGWANTISGADNFEFKNTMRVPDNTVYSRGNTLVSNVTCQPGHTSNAGGANVIRVPDGNFTLAQGGTVYSEWVEIITNSDKVSNFIDVEPLFNTDNGGRLGTWANITDDTNINGGGWNWQIDMRIAATGTPEDVTTLRGGIVVGKCGIIQPLKGQVMNGADSRNNFLTGGTDFTIWWEIVRVSVPTGAITCNFYYRPTSFIGQPQTNGAVLWGQVALPATAESQRISMRPLLYTGGANPKYVIECYGATVNTIANTIVGATVTGASVPLALDGYFTVSDPDDTTAANIRCDLYRNLPLRQCVVNPRSNGRLPVKINAIHHGDGGTDMAGANQLASLPYSFGFSSIDPYQQTVDKLDGINATLSRKSTIGYALGFQTAWVQQTATLMIGTGVVAEIPITESIPLNTSLVVTLPDLPISGFYGNSAGSASAGTLNLNAGGQAGCILAVIPFTQAPIRATALGEGQRGVFYASPMENWIKLKNPTSFNISSLRCVITDALGQKPHCLAPNTTVCIKIKAPNGGENARLQIQG